MLQLAQRNGIGVSERTITRSELYSAEEALQLGLVDEIAPAQEAVNQIAAAYSGVGGRSVAAQASAMNLENQL